jgi:hypothetical protein
MRCASFEFAGFHFAGFQVAVSRPGFSSKVGFFVLIPCLFFLHLVSQCDGSVPMMVHVSLPLRRYVHTQTAAAEARLARADDGENGWESISVELVRFGFLPSSSSSAMAARSQVCFHVVLCIYARIMCFIQCIKPWCMDNNFSHFVFVTF